MYLGNIENFDFENIDEYLTNFNFLPKANKMLIYQSDEARVEFPLKIGGTGWLEIGRIFWKYSSDFYSWDTKLIRCDTSLRRTDNFSMPLKSHEESVTFGKNIENETITSFFWADKKGHLFLEIVPKDEWSLWGGLELSVC